MIWPALSFFVVGAWLGLTIGFVVAILAFAPVAPNEGPNEGPKEGKIDV